VFGQDERELVAAVAEDEVGVATGRTSRRRSGAAACRRPGGPVVVDGPEVVEVEHDQAERRAVARAPVEPLLERAVVEQPGQVVGPGRISTAWKTSAFWSAIETCAANSWTSSNSSA
jgi:hypothetical protein